MKHFETLEYLKNGNAKQREAYRLLTTHLIFEHLKEFDPILVGTIPIDIDIDESDLDIICYSKSLEGFKSSINKIFSQQDHFMVQESKGSIHSVVARFTLEQFQIELFAQSVPTKEQFGYRHMLIEHQLLQERGEEFRQQIIQLKKDGYKTEPAFAKLLGLVGDPYGELLNVKTKPS